MGATVFFVVLGLVLLSISHGASAQTSNWTNPNPTSSPSPRVFSAMAYNPVSDKIVLFGGTTGPPSYTAVYQDTWLYDVGANTWTQVFPATSPSPRDMHRMVYDSASQKMVMFGGCEGSANCNAETWLYSVASNTWTNAAPSSSPPYRWGHSMANDSIHEKVVLFGGATAPGVNDETWIYDSATNTWTNPSPTSRPSPRFFSDMAYDPVTNKVVLFGGQDNSVAYQDTWLYDVGANTWTQVFPATSPSQRDMHRMVYDSTTQNIVMFGGCDMTANCNAETWLYNATSNTWTNAAPSSSPPYRWGHSMAYDSAQQKVVLFGGATAPGLSADTWLYAETAPPTAPSAPQNLQATPGDSQVTLTWGVPTSNGGSPITNYRIYGGTTSGGETFLIEVGDVLTYTNTSLTNGQIYYYKVSAKNSVGEGPKSNEADATPKTTPLAPQNLQASAGDAQIALTWTAPTSNGGSVITNYRIYRGTTSGGETFLIEVGDVLTYTNTGLTNGQIYYYKVSAKNSVGEGSQSNEASATPIPIPTQPSASVDIWWIMIPLLIVIIAVLVGLTVWIRRKKEGTAPKSAETAVPPSPPAAPPQTQSLTPQQKLTLLDERFARGEVSESLYRELREKYQAESKQR